MSYETYRAAANQLAIVTIELQVRRSIEALQAVVPIEKHYQLQRAYVQQVKLLGFEIRHDLQVRLKSHDPYYACEPSTVKEALKHLDKILGPMILEEMEVSHG